MSVVDKVLAVRGQWGGPNDETGYQPEQVVHSVVYNHIPGSDTLTIIFPPWGVSEFLNKLLAKRLRRQGSSQLQINFSPLIMHSDPQMVVKSFRQAADTIINEVNKRDIYSTYTYINLVGFSLGNGILSMVSAKLQRFDAITMVVPGTDLAAVFWTSLRTRQLSDGYRQRGMQLKELRQQWRPMSALTHLEAFAGHPITVILASRDRYVLPVLGTNLVEAMVQAGLKPTVKTRKLGHVSTVVWYALGGF